MNRIRLLPEQLANQIAAGEVIERPASVVKELVENSLDAQATRITIEVQAGGRSLIRVTDDGIGMSADDALLCFERHATSKIRTVSDLTAISTMGFRGEALPSIASVSRLMLTTRERSDNPAPATQVVIHGGKIVAVKEASGSPGTDIEVRQLFFNLPARRKFLRSEETERAHIQHYCTLAALAFPGIGFTLRQEGRLVWQLPPLAPTEDRVSLDGLKGRLSSLLGPVSPLLAVDVTTELSSTGAEAEMSEGGPQQLRVRGFIGAPGISRATRQDQHLFVNRRPVENRGLSHALLEAYHTALMKGRYPVCCLFIEIDPGEVDVNIHPAKREVKFRQEGLVRRAVMQAVRGALLDYHAKIAVEGTQSGTEGRPATPTPVGSTTVPSASKSGLRSDLSPISAGTPDLLPTLPTKPISSWPEHSRADIIQPPAASADRAAPAPTSTVAPFQPSPPLLAVPLRLVGVIAKLYVVLESDRGLVLLDQHAAHERVLFEQMLRRLEQDGVPSQRLLLPETVELSPRDGQFLKEQLGVLNRLGVGLSEFGERTFLLDALPTVVKITDGRRFVLELIDELKAAGREVNSWRLGEQTVAKTVCRHAVKANDALAGPELENLLHDLRHCAMPYTCPHGRPTLIEMNFRELEKKFGRIQ